MLLYGLGEGTWGPGQVLSGQAVARLPSTKCQLRLRRSRERSRLSLRRHWIFRRASAKLPAPDNT